MNSAGPWVGTSAVVHLLRASNDETAFARFVDSYRRFPAGASHQLVFICKGFGRALPAKLLALVGDLRPTLIHVKDRGFDIGPYAIVARQLEVDALCFLNSFTVLLAEDWLAKLLAGLTEPEVGIAGATASWQSVFSSSFPPGWQRPLPRRIGRWPRWLGRHYRRMTFQATFPPFPNPHVRSTGFVIRRNDFLALEVPALYSKQAAYRFESGLHSMTRQLERRGLRPLVVDRGGLHSGVADWHESHTFWSGDQENLLIADNQTENYRRAAPAGRRALEMAAWLGGPAPRSIDADSMQP